LKNPWDSITKYEHVLQHNGDKHKTVKIASQFLLRSIQLNSFKYTMSRNKLIVVRFLTNYKNVKQAPQNGVDLDWMLLKIGLILSTLLKMRAIL